MSDPNPPSISGTPKPQLPWERAGAMPQDRRGEARPGEAPAAPDAASFGQIKQRVHRRLLERLNLSNLDKLTREQVTDAIRKVTLDLIAQESAPLNFEEREELVKQVLDEIFGLGPIQPLIEDPEISDVLVNTYKSVFIERHGRLERTDVRFQDDRHLLQVIDRIVSAVGRRIDDSSPMVDARLPDGSRVNAIIPPLAIDGAVMSIRRFGAEITMQNLVEKGALTDEMAMLLAGCVRARLNISSPAGRAPARRRC
jgi:pilus assembly protein CpaF